MQTALLASVFILRTRARTFFPSLGWKVGQLGCVPTLPLPQHLRAGVGGFPVLGREAWGFPVLGDKAGVGRPCPVGGG